METEKKNKIFKIFLIGLMALFAIIPFSLKLKDINEVNAQGPSPSDFTPYALTYTNNWTSHTLTNFGNNFYFNRCWTDGTNIYYSRDSYQYVLDISSLTWSAKTWNNLNFFDGSQVWSDGSNFYYSSSTSQYVLDISTSTWSVKTWIGLTEFYGASVWTDGTNIYYSRDSSQYVLDISTSTWSAKTWFNYYTIDGRNIWSDGSNYYYSDGSNQYVLDISTSYWTSKTWTGLTSFAGQYIWTDGTNIYFSNASSQYVLDISTSTWSVKTWTGLTSFSGLSVFDNLSGVIICFGSYSTDNSNWFTLDIDNSGGGSGGGGNDTNTLYSFTGSSYLLYGWSNTKTQVNTLNGHFELEDNNTTTFDINYIYYRQAISFDTFGTTHLVAEGFTQNSLSMTLNLNTAYTNEKSDGYSSLTYHLNVTTTGWTNCDIVGCTISSEIDIDANDNTKYWFCYRFNYFNSNNDNLIIELYIHTKREFFDYNSYLLDYYILYSTRTIYFNNNASSSGNYQTGYDAGYNAGLDQGYDNGYNAGSVDSYNLGYNAGLDQGYDNGYDAGESYGYNKGVAEANDYSFFSLISAVVDTPISAFTNLFNFTILGVNMFDFLTGLVTLALCLLIVKFIMGGWR